MPLTPFLVVYVCMYVSIGKKGRCGRGAGCCWDAASRVSKDWVQRRCFSCSGRWWAEEICIAVSGPAASSQTPTSLQGPSDAAFSGNIGTYTVGAH